MIKSSLGPAEYLKQDPPDAAIRTKDGGKYIAIEELEKLLDFFDWGTQNFVWEYHEAPNGEKALSASLELCLSWEGPAGEQFGRCFVGTCNFLLSSMAANTHFLATAKSECVKNAASDAGRKFGRGLNEREPGEQEIQSDKPKAKIEPDAGIIKQYGDVLLTGNKKKIDLLLDMYNIKTEHYGD